jgi:hypothetical protein
MIRSRGPSVSRYNNRDDGGRICSISEIETINLDFRNDVDRMERM